MVDATYIDNGRIQVVQNDDIAFDTERPSITLLPESSRIIHSDMDVIFPSFIQAASYFRGTKGPDAICEYWSTLFWQEWGPTYGYHNEVYYPANPAGSIPGPTTRNIPRIHLGTVPSICNHLDIRARFTRLQGPPPFYGVAEIFPLVPEGQWINLSSGGSCPMEALYPMARHLDIRRHADDIYVELYQSCYNTDFDYDTGPAGWPNRDIRVNQSGWNSRTAYSTSDLSGVVPKSNNNIIYLMNSKGPYPLGENRRPGGGDACSFSTFHDMTSHYKMDIIITPGIYKS